ncbi:hypothetical protein CVT25_003816 [Psilocybe cyanescens]|uniref:Uncharacterized protein n=1 Tax=Psilocybe cyanescens TaxID=93625 RepID=A0A409XTM6_PSICY|nr:hypothetical protein CVT25_003816 [Psilocybe cyanescens]
MWLLLVVSFLASIHGLGPQPGSNKGQRTYTRYCSTDTISPYIALDVVVPLVHDTLVFLAISWKLANNSVQDVIIWHSIQAMIFGDHMPAFSRALLQDGQIYYLTTISTGLLALVMLFIPGIQVTFRTSFVAPNIMLMNIMAGHVFRKTRFGIFPENGISTVNVTQTLPLTFDPQVSESEAIAAATLAEPQILNPFTPMAFLLPEVASQVVISGYMVVGSCGVFIWDVINNIKADYILLSRYPMRFPTIVYIMSRRLATLGYVLSATIYQTAPVGRCARFEMALNVFNTIAIPITSILFFIRVRAIYEGNKFVSAFFALMWLAVLAGSFSTTQGVTGTAIGPTSYCMISQMSPYVVAAGVIPLVNDTMIFLAISWRLMRNSLHHVNFKHGVRAIIFGDYMPVFSRALLQDGQIYYL